MAEHAVTVRVSLDEKTFKRFAVFDTLVRQKRWRSPLTFAGILLVFSIACFILRGMSSQAVFIGVVLLVVGLGLPAAYFASFFFSIRTQAKTQKLGTGRYVYTLELDGHPKGVRIEGAGGETAKFEWKSLHAAYRMEDCTYLYVMPGRAFLLPDSQVRPDTGALWELLSEKLPEEKRFDRRKAKA